MHTPSSHRSTQSSLEANPSLTRVYYIILFIVMSRPLVRATWNIY